MLLKNKLLLLPLLLSLASTHAQPVTEDPTTAFIQAQPFTDNPATAFLLARASGEKILLVFSGSDWCMPCIRFEKKVLGDSAFRRLVRGRLVVLKADFPQHKKIPDTLRTQYEMLAQRFDPDGTFPRIVLLDAEQRLLAVLVYADQPVPVFVQQLNDSMKHL